MAITLSQSITQCAIKLAIKNVAAIQGHAINLYDCAKPHTTF